MKNNDVEEIFDDDVVQPPSTNRGAGRTTETSLTLCCDWVSGTSKKIACYESLLALLNLDFSLFSESETSRNGFKKMYNYNGVNLLLEHKDVYFMLDITGEGCRFLESLNNYSWIDFFKIFLLYDLNFTRLDLALDSINDFSFSLFTMYKKIKFGHVKGSFRRFKNFEDICFNTGIELGRTLYFGSPKSNFMFRFYDKFGESLSKGKTIESGVMRWIRYEIQFRGDYAKAMILNIVFGGIDDIGFYFKGFLRSNLEFLIPSKTDSNKRRWKICKWWLDFLDNVGKLPLKLNYKEPTLFKKVNWLENGVSKTNALVNLAGYYGLSNPLNLTKGYLKLLDSKEDLAIFNDFLIKSGNEPLNMRTFNTMITNFLDLEGIKKDDYYGI